MPLGEASSSPTDPQWRWLRYGVLLKQLAFVVLLAVLALGYSTSWVFLFPPTVARRLAVLLMPLVIDFIGRCCCALIPARRRESLIVSIGFQGAGLIGLIACSLWPGLDIAGLVVGVLWAVLMQVLAAVLFTNFLRHLVEEFHDPRLDERVQRLHASLRETLSAGVVFGFSFAGVAVVAVVFGLFTYGIALCIAVPIGVVALLPIAIWLFVRIGVMWTRYGITLFSVAKLLETVPPKAAEEFSTPDDD